MNDVLYSRATDLIEEYIPKEPEIETQGDEEALYTLAQTAGWRVLKQLIEEFRKQLQEVNVKETDTVEAVGYKYLASRTADTYLTSILDTVEETYKVVDERLQAKNKKAGNR